MNTRHPHSAEQTPEYLGRVFLITPDEYRSLPDGTPLTSGLGERLRKSESDGVLDENGEVLDPKVDDWGGYLCLGFGEGQAQDIPTGLQLDEDKRPCWEVKPVNARSGTGDPVVQRAAEREKERCEILIKLLKSKKTPNLR